MWIALAVLATAAQKLVENSEGKDAIRGWFHAWQHRAAMMRDEIR